MSRNHVTLVAAVFALNVLSFVDRQLVVALAPLLIADLGLTRADIGLLVGAAFMLLYSVGTQLVGSWSDRGNRPRLIASGLGIWSLATTLTSTASGLASLAAWRAFVGIGEAALPATALSMIGDRVAPRRLGLANGVFYAGIPFGYALSLALSGAIAPRFGWRACFAVLGALGLLAAVLVLRLADPPRRASGHSAAGSAPVAAILRERPAILLLTLAGVLMVYSSAASQHTITWLVSERGFGYARAAFQSAGVILAAGLAGSLAIGAATDRATRAHPAGRLLALAAIAVPGLAAALVFYRADAGSAFFVPSWIVSHAFLLGWYGTLVAAVYERAPEGRRGSVIGFLLLAVNLVGVALGPYVTGLVGDRAGLTHALQWSLVPGILGAALAGAVGLAEWRRAPRAQSN